MGFRGKSDKKYGCYKRFRERFVVRAKKNRFGWYVSDTSK